MIGLIKGDTSSIDYGLYGVHIVLMEKKKMETTI